jgi:hypothetical protein
VPWGIDLSLRGRCLPRPRESRTRSSGGLQDSCSWGSRPAKVRGKRRRGTTTLFVLHHEVVISAAGDLSEQAKFKCTKARPSPVAAAEKAQSPCLDTEAAGTRPLESLRAHGCCSRRRRKKRCPRRKAKLSSASHKRMRWSEWCSGPRGSERKA